LRLVEGEDRTKRSSWRLSGKQALLLVVGVAMFFTLIYSRVHLDRAAFEMSRIQSQIQEQQSIMQELRIEVAELEAPARIYAEAERMGMVLPAEVGTVVAEVPVAEEPVVADPGTGELILGSLGATR
jgi:cell division protein FtsL